MSQRLPAYPCQEIKKPRQIKSERNHKMESRNRKTLCDHPPFLSPILKDCCTLCFIQKRISQGLWGEGTRSNHVAFPGRSSLLTQPKIDSEGGSPANTANPAKALGLKPAAGAQIPIKIKKASASQPKVKQAKTSCEVAQDFTRGKIQEF